MTISRDEVCSPFRRPGSEEADAPYKYVGTSTSITVIGHMSIPDPNVGMNEFSADCLPAGEVPCAAHGSSRGGDAGAEEGRREVEEKGMEGVRG